MIAIAEPIIDEGDISAVLEVLHSGHLAQGPRVRELEERFAKFCGTNYAVATSSGTTALHIALLAQGICPEDEIITTSFSFIASANCVLYVGGKPVFADIEPEYYTISPEDIARRITPKTRAIIPVHLFGQPCDMEAIENIAQEHHLAIIEDACQAHGAKVGNRYVGSFGTACYSFYPTKNMTTIEGGMITTDDPEIANHARLIRNHGCRQRYLHECLGFNSRLTDLSAAIGISQLSKLERWNQIRQSNAQYLTERLSNVPGITTPRIREGTTHIFHQYTIRVSDREELVEKLIQRGIGYEIYYPIPIHQQPLYRNLGYSDVLPQAERASKEVLSLPIHPSVSKEDLDIIIDAVASIQRDTQGAFVTDPSLFVPQ